MIENRNTLDKGLESALKALEQVKARVENEKKRRTRRNSTASYRRRWRRGNVSR